MYNLDIDSTIDRHTTRNSLVQLFLLCVCVCTDSDRIEKEEFGLIRKNMYQNALYMVRRIVGRSVDHFLTRVKMFIETYMVPYVGSYYIVPFWFIHYLVHIVDMKYGA